jgi:hypothetical protein
MHVRKIKGRFCSEDVCLTGDEMLDCKDCRGDNDIINKYDGVSKPDPLAGTQILTPCTSLFKINAAKSASPWELATFLNINLWIA